MPHDRPTMQKINGMWTCDSRLFGCHQAMLFVALVSGKCIFLPFRAKPGTASHLLCTLVSPWSAHQSGTKSEAQPGFAWLSHRIEHRTSKLDLTCLAHDPTHTHLRVCSPARHLGWSSLAGLDPAIDHNIFILVSEKKEKGGRRKTTKTTTTTPSRHHQQTHRPIVYRLLLSRSLLSMNQPRR